ncbi:MAG: TonB-dependent receptor [Candidatus Thiodiazotropha sp.]|nr:TonB-dependent receptor [Candidatus Thiodiazotropha sp.]
MISPIKLAAMFCAILSFFLLIAPVQAEESVDSYLDLTLEDLLNIEVTSVSKKKQRLNEAAAAVYVITQEDIRRSGVTSIPEALRMAPGIHVGRLDANKWAISSRGFNNQFANKLLVLIDGRSVYTPVYSGVYWDAQDTLLEDIDRIEVIRGPGASLWGANAVNGVINIITKPASETQGGLLVAGAGDEEKIIGSLRYGSELNDSTHGRYYLKFNDRDSSYSTTLDDQAGDDWDKVQGGFRFDSLASGSDQWTFQGDFYDAEINQRVNEWKDPNDPANIVFAPFYLSTLIPDEVDVSGWNLLTRWDHVFSSQSNSTLQLYYDFTKRDGRLLGQQYKTLDIDYQHQLQFSKSHDLLWGLGYRYIQYDFNNTFNAEFLHDNRSVDLFSAFVQDEIILIPESLRLILGSKFEHNEFTGFEVQPSARLVWLASERSTIWTSVSRAVRTPSYVEEDSRIVTRVVSPFVFYSNGGDDFESEELLAYEVGYRFQPRVNISLDLAIFYNDYDKQRSFETSPVPTNFFFDNKLSASTYGLEWVMDWRPLEWWQLKGNYSYIQIDSDLLRGSTSPIDLENVSENSYPQHQVSLRSNMDLSHQVSLDLWLYYVDKLNRSSFSVPMTVSNYSNFNVHLAWQLKDNIEISLIGQNLLDNRHMEFVGEKHLTQTEIERSVYAKIRLDF